MRRVWADFAPERKLPKPVWVALSALLLLMVALAVFSASKLQQAERELEKVRASLRLSKEGLASDADAMARASLVRPPFDASALAWEAERRAPLGDALRALERTQIDGVVVRSLEINASQGLVRLGVDAPSHEVLVLFEQALNEGTPPKEPGVLQWRLMLSVAATQGSSVRGTLEGKSR